MDSFLLVTGISRKVLGLGLVISVMANEDDGTGNLVSSLQ